MRCFRIGDSRFPLFDPTGARMHGGRWNSPGQSVIYAAETYAGAILEILVHTNLSRLPRTHASISIEIPDDLAMERIETHQVSGWDAPDQIVSRAFGDRWIQEKRTAVFLVPALVTRGHERNVLLNPSHPAFSRIQHSGPEPVIFDERLFTR